MKIVEQHTGDTFDQDDLRSSVALLILQPTPFCNIDCRYCYLPDRNNKNVMTADIFSATIARLLEDHKVGRELSIVWHAGEPMVLPIDYYKDMMAVPSRLLSPDVKVRHNFQTNGTLINDDWCEFIKSQDIAIGVSLDGPQEIHDENRLDRAGRGSYERTMAGIRLLQKHEIPFHSISVLTLNSLKIPDVMFEFFRTENIRRIGFNVEELEGANRSSGLMAEEASPLFRAFFYRFLNKCNECDDIEWVREADDALMHVLNDQEEPIFNTQVEPFSMVSVAWDGEFTTFSPEFLGMSHKHYGTYSLGNILHSSFEDVRISEHFKQIWDEIKLGVENCRSECEYFSVCGGGSPVNKYFENGSCATTETMYCRLTVKATTDVVLDLLEEEHQSFLRKS